LGWSKVQEAFDMDITAYSSFMGPLQIPTRRGMLSAGFRFPVSPYTVIVLTDHYIEHPDYHEEEEQP
jgi:hypothetical protein